MKRALLVTAMVLSCVPAAYSTAAARDTDDAPVISKMAWKDSPVTTSSGECDDQGVCDEEILIIEAQDRDSSITEVEVWFDENGSRAPFVWAHTYCVQGTEPGTLAHLEIGATFTEPGDYVVAAVAHSHRECLGHEDGDEHAAEHSDITRLPTTVRRPLRLLLDDPLVEGGSTRVRLRNDSNVAYRFNYYYEACYMVFRERGGRRFLIPEGTHCDLVAYEEVPPGQTVTLFEWDLDECVDDRWGCRKTRDLPPGKYSMRGFFKPMGGGEATQVIKRFRIRRD